VASSRGNDRRPELVASSSLPIPHIRKLVCAHDVAEMSRIERIELSDQKVLTLGEDLEWVEDGMCRR
jgi:hypothetical protein